MRGAARGPARFRTPLPHTRSACGAAVPDGSRARAGRRTCASHPRYRTCAHLLQGEVRPRASGERRRRHRRHQRRPRLRIRARQRDLPDLPAARTHRARSRRADAPAAHAADRSQGSRLRRCARPATSRRTEIVNGLRFSHEAASSYDDVLTPDAVAALHALAPFDHARQQLMTARLTRRAARAKERRRIPFLDPNLHLPGTSMTVRDAREGRFVGSAIPHDLKRQWIQGTGPAARPHGTPETSLRNIAYALLSGADGWMFDGEDALGQLSTMALDNQRNLKLAYHR